MLNLQSDYHPGHVKLIAADPSAPAPPSPSAMRTAVCTCDVASRFTRQLTINPNQEIPRPQTPTAKARPDPHRNCASTKRNMSADDDNRQLTVFRGSPPKNSYVWSPFVTKLEARLRFSGVPYRLGGGSPRSAPKGKIPYVELAGPDGEPRTMGDSTLIIWSLVEAGTLTDVNAALSPAQRAHDLAIRALLEDKVYFYGSREKWCDNYDEMRASVLASVPWPLRIVVGWLAYRAVSQGLYQQGTARLTDDEVHLLKEEVWDSLNALLTESIKTSSRQKSKTNDDDAPFWLLGGPEPTEVDATVYGFIAGALVCTAAPATAKIVQSYPTIIDYAERIHSCYFPDYERWA